MFGSEELTQVMAYSISRLLIMSVIVSDPSTSGALGYHSSVVLSIIIVMVAAFMG